MFRRLQTVCLRTFSVLVVLLVVSSISNSQAEDVPVTKLSSNFGAPTLRILYCYACGYRKAYEEYVNIIKDRYPEIITDGANYDPPGFNMFLARFVGIIKMVIIACILGQVNIFGFFNKPQPSWYQWCLENKLYACLMLFFLCNIIEGQLIQTGAFEMSLNDVPVWSKLQTGRIPQPAELFQIIDNHMQFSGTRIEVPNNGFAK